VKKDGALTQINFAKIGIYIVENTEEAGIIFLLVYN
jgi:hypothetical protein